MQPITDETIDHIYEQAQHGHDYQLHTLTKAQVVAIIDRMREAEKQVAEAAERYRDAIGGY